VSGRTRSFDDCVPDQTFHRVPGRCGGFPEPEQLDIEFPVFSGEEGEEKMEVEDLCRLAHDGLDLRSPILCVVSGQTECLEQLRLKLHDLGVCDAANAGEEGYAVFHTCVHRYGSGV
jgi:hypothetical protein